MRKNARPAININKHALLDYFNGHKFSLDRLSRGMMTSDMVKKGSIFCNEAYVAG